VSWTDRVRALPQTTEGSDRGHEYYRRRPDRSYSLTDCIAITDVLTNDRHFEQEGFRALLRVRG